MVARDTVSGLVRPIFILAYGANVPEQAEPPPSPRLPLAAPHTDLGTRRLDAVLFDFHGTLAQVEDPITWVRSAAANCGTILDAPAAALLADRLVTAGRAGGPVPRRVPPHLIDVWAERDLYDWAHRAAFVGLAETVSNDIDGLAEALYARVRDPQGWYAYADSVATISALLAGGIRVGLVSNIGFDIRPVLAAHGLGDLLDTVVLSLETGRLKPDPAIFYHACGALGVEPERTLMVGDSAADGAAIAVGCTVYLVPAAAPGEPNGLDAVRVLAGCSAIA
jgi:FMN phosphatase YigB (HAD superfamily)